MKNFKLNWKIKLSIGLVGLSTLLYLLHYAIYRDARHIFIYLLGDIAFIPIDVLLVVLVIHGIITGHEKRLMIKKLNMVIGAFFSEVGTELLRYFSGFDVAANTLKEKLAIKKEWTQKDYASLANSLRNHEFKVDAKKGDLTKLRGFLITKREFLLRLLENPNLLEHEGFTELLWAVFHLAEELSARNQIHNLPDSDYEHLSNDIKRAYSSLVAQWLAYMRHLNRDYPYLFSLALRTNPFDKDASVVVR
jgi:hypothetical protein